MTETERRLRDIAEALDGIKRELQRIRDSYPTFVFLPNDEPITPDVMQRLAEELNAQREALSPEQVEILRDDLRQEWQDDLDALRREIWDARRTGVGA